MIIGVDTRFGQLVLEADETSIIALRLGTAPLLGETSLLLAEAAAQIKAYEDGTLQKFDLPLAPKGSAFQQGVFAAMRAIPYGETMSYGQIAAALGCPAQPVGQACGANPIPLLIPCHRVLSKTGLGGFSGLGGLESKIALLQHEGGFPFLL